MAEPSNDILAAIMRNMAWERAKGELESMRVTFYGREEQYKELDKKIREFVKDVEDYGLQE